MESTTSIALERISVLLDVVETSAKSLREFLQRQKLNGSTDKSRDYSARTAQNLGLPFHEDAEVARQASVLRITCEQLGRLVTPPRHLLFEAAGSFYTTLALQIMIKYDLATLIKEVSEGVSASDLSLKCKLDADLLTRLLRYLSHRGIFQELEPGIFANTVASSALIDDSEFKAHLDLVMYEGQLAAPYFEELMKHRFTATREGMAADSDEPPASSFVIFSEGVPWFKWLHQAANVDRAKNFHLAMRGMSRTEGLDFLPVDYPFNSFGSNTVIVDVGGGIGSLAEILLPVIPNLRFVIQDLGPVVALANEVASPRMKHWITEGKVKFQVHDLFTPQPHGLEMGVFILKALIHNYPDSKAIKILAAIQSSRPLKLLVIDRLVTPVLRAEAPTHTKELEINTKVTDDTPHPIDIDGVVSVSSQGIPTLYDLIMASLPGGRVRGLEEWKKLLSDGGFRLLKVYPLRASTGQAILEAIPI